MDNLGGSGRDPYAQVLTDPSGVSFLCIGGANFNWRSRAYIRLSGGRWLQFPVRGRGAGSAVMTALDQNGDAVALFRMVPAGGSPSELGNHKIADSGLPPLRQFLDSLGPERFPLGQQVEIAVHPDQVITDELLVILASSAPWLWTYFVVPSENGGG
jgi:hypothetical protein